MNLVFAFVNGIYRFHQDFLAEDMSLTDQLAHYEMEADAIKKVDWPSHCLRVQAVRTFVLRACRFTQTEKLGNWRLHF